MTSPRRIFGPCQILEGLLSDQACFGDLIRAHDNKTVFLEYRPDHMVEHHVGMAPLFTGVLAKRRNEEASLVPVYLGSAGPALATPSGLVVDRVLLPADERTRI